MMTLVRMMTVAGQHMAAIWRSRWVPVAESLREGIHTGTTMTMVTTVTMDLPWNLLIIRLARSLWTLADRGANREALERDRMVPRGGRRRPATRPDRVRIRMTMSPYQTLKISNKAAGRKNHLRPAWSLGMDSGLRSWMSGTSFPSFPTLWRADGTT